MNIRKSSVYSVGFSLFAAALFAGIEPSQSKSIRIELTVDQLVIVQQCMNAAVKLGGLSDARVILPVWDSIEAQAKQQIEPKSP